MVRKPTFIVYFIKRKNMLPEMGAEIEHIIVNKKGLRKTRILRPWRGACHWIQAIPLAYVFDHRGPLFLVKRKDTDKHEDWLEDYREFPDPDWSLMGILNRERANRAAAWRRAQA